MDIGPKQLLHEGNARLHVFFNNDFSIRWCGKQLECRFQWQRGGNGRNRAVSMYAYREDGSTVAARKEKARTYKHSTK